MPVRSSRQRGLHRRGQQRARRDVQGQEGALGAAGDGERGAHGQRLELLAEADAMRLREPLVRAAARLGLDARQRLDSHRHGPWRAPPPAGRRSGSSPRRARAAPRSRCAARPPGAPRRARSARSCPRPERLAQYSAASAFSSSTAASDAVGGRGGDTRGGGQRAPAHGQLAQRGPRALGAVLGGLGVGAGQDQHELLAAQAAHDVTGADDRAQALGGGDQHPVALGVAERVVDDLEVVEIDQHHRDRPAVRQRRPQPLVAGAVVQEPGERVPLHLLAQRVALARRVIGQRGHRREALDQLDLFVGKAASAPVR